MLELSGMADGRLQVIQSILFFGFGFLCAMFLALMIAPSIWRRAVRLTRRRIEATVPLSLNEIQAEKDALRAEFAMSTRRLEMSVKKLQGKTAAQTVEINRAHEELKRITEERDKANTEIAGLEGRIGELDATLQQRSGEMETLSAALAAAREDSAGKQAEIDRLQRETNDFSMEVSNRQIELVARETEIAKLAGDVGLLKEQRKESEQKLRELGLDNKSGREALKAERARSAEFERRLERAAATLADREEALDQRERELTRLRERLKKGKDQEGAPAQEGRPAIEAQMDAGEAQSNENVQSSAPIDAERESALARLSDERKRLEERLTTLTRENKRLRTSSLPQPTGKAGKVVVSGRGTDKGASGGGASGDAELREQISALAAEMIALTATLEGKGSPIVKMLGEAGPDDADGASPSLADRVRALRQAAAKG